MCTLYCIEMCVLVRATGKDVGLEPITDMMGCDVTMQV